jgi:hypothetical protein
MAWEFHGYDAASGAAVASLDVASWSSKDVRSDSGEWSAVLTPPDSPSVARSVLAATVAGRNVILAVRDGSIIFSGYLPPGGRRLPEIAGAGLLSYLDRRRLIIATDRVYTAMDQHLMVADLVDYTNAAHGIGIDTSQVKPSGVLRDQTWHPWELKNIGEALRQKAQLLNGFDLDVRTELDAGSLIRRVRCWYPRRGLSVSQGGPIFEVGVNALVEPTLTGNEDFATTTLALGFETNSTTQQRLLASKETTSLLTAGWPEIDVVLDLVDVKEAPTLQAHADGFAQLNDDPDLGSPIEVEVNPNDDTWPWGSWDLGSDARLIIPANYFPWWPDGYSLDRRVEAHRWEWSVTDGEHLYVTLGPPWTL